MLKRFLKMTTKDKYKLSWLHLIGNILELPDLLIRAIFAKWILNEFGQYTFQTRLWNVASKVLAKAMFHHFDSNSPKEK